jgi:hypothetical protein
MVKKILKIKQWLLEQNEAQFKPIRFSNSNRETISAVQRKADNLIFELGTINGATIHKFHDDMINVTITSWIDTSLGGFNRTYTIPIEILPETLAIPFPLATQFTLK